MIGMYCVRYNCIIFLLILCAFYCVLPAVKCNDSPVVLSLLAQLGSGFDCASKVGGFRASVSKSYCSLLGHMLRKSCLNVSRIYFTVLLNTTNFL